MRIGFWNGDFWRFHESVNDRFVDTCIEDCRGKWLANAIELHCLNEENIDYLLTNDKLDLLGFDFVSLHSPDLAYGKDEESRRVLSKMAELHKKYNVNNFVFHTDKVVDWDVFLEYNELPIWVENMDDRKDFGKSISDVKSILDKYNFNLTLDLQHCFVNDESMKLAQDFQEMYWNRIVEYHISWYDEKLLHHPLFKTKQDIIIKNLIYKDIPIIIESVFDEIWENEEELAYIKNRL